VSTASELLDLRGATPDDLDLAPVVDHVRADGLVAYPTETVYGFGGLCSPAAVTRLQALKSREALKPFLVLVQGIQAVDGLAWTEEARELASIFWPGSLTLVLRDPARIFPEGVRSSAGAVAIRVSPHPLVGALLGALGAPLTSTSANAPGAPPARSGREALQAAADLDAGPEMWILDSGALPPSGPSTIVDCTGDRPSVIREGTIPVNRLTCALPELHGR
jgi:L-threonylcarbamoyladenylate synthase